MKTFSLEKPNLVHIPEKGMWVLSKPWSLQFPLRDGSVYRLDLRPGFVSDGASIPRPLWPICGHPDRQPRVIAALVHDWLYSSKRLPRADADFVYAAISSSLGIPFSRWCVEFTALRLFGSPAWRSHDCNDQLFADGLGVLTKIN